MYFKIEKSGCNTNKGYLEIRYDCFLEDGDFGRNKFPKKGEVIDGQEITEDVTTDFCGHFVQFTTDVTDEEILYVGELALDMAYRNWCNGELKKNKNLPFAFDKTDTAKVKMCKDRLDKVLTTDFAKVAVKSKVPYRVK